ncbi:NAD(P)H-nitrite reductase large subunit [Alkalibacillus filiformis]|uniref:NAD(P)H-nitrite reductase large subunit n=1 Tax=Alkalibacillus filiformis TaxID=200990 RepID=A0ABU0DUG8_9BACI|nr:nitrite reductase [Alkalibacillus filiformis]MDQ0352103.1 NAD(P)H-nitrite reductase large subunit [Alkalibacillus filiformis]
MTERYIPLAINGGIGYGSWLKPKQLIVLGEYLGEDQEIELTTLQQLIVKIPESQFEDAKKKFDEVGLYYYKVGNYVKSLRTCNFCKGEEEEGMPVAKELNNRIAGQEVPFTLRPAYTGCPVGCGEPLVNDIGVMKKKEHYQLYIGGQAKGYNAKVGQLFADDLTSEELFDLVDRVLEVYRQNGRKREKFSKFISRYGFENIKEELKLGKLNH